MTVGSCRDLIALFEQELGQIRAVLPGDSSDKRAFAIARFYQEICRRTPMVGVEVVGCRWGAERMTRRERLTEQVESFLEPGEHLHGAFDAQTGIPAWVWGGTGGLGGALIRVADRGLGVLLVAIAGLVLVVFASYLLGTRTWVVAGTDKRTLVFTTGRIRRRTVTGLDSEGPPTRSSPAGSATTGELAWETASCRVSAGEAREIETINDELTAEGDRTPPANPPRPDLRSRIITIASVVAVHCNRVLRSLCDPRCRQQERVAFSRRPVVPVASGTFENGTTWSIEAFHDRDGKACSRVEYEPAPPPADAAIPSGGIAVQSGGGGTSCGNRFPDTLGGVGLNRDRRILAGVVSDKIVSLQLKACDGRSTRLEPVLALGDRWLGFATTGPAREIVGLDANSKIVSRHVFEDFAAEGRRARRFRRATRAQRTLAAAERPRITVRPVSRCSSGRKRNR